MVRTSESIVRRFSLVVKEDVSRESEARFGIANDSLPLGLDSKIQNAIARREDLVEVNGGHYRKAFDEPFGGENYRGFGKCREVRYELVKP